MCVERERERARVELCLYFWPSKFFGIGALAMASDDDVDDVKIPVSLLLNRLEYFSVALWWCRYEQKRIEIYI